MRLLLLSFIFLGLQASSALGQQRVKQKHGLSIQTKIHAGFVWMHRQGVEHLVQRGVSGIQLDLLLKPSGKADWHSYSGFPDVGVTLLHMRLSYAELGEAYGAIPYLSLLDIKRGKFTFEASGGMGLAYLNNPWNRTENRKNEMIGSHLNLAVTLQTNISYAITKRWLLMGGLAFTHFSNAGTQKPNLGVNIPSSFVGIRFSGQETPEYSEQQKITLVEQRRELILLASGFVNQFDVLNTPRLALTTALEAGFYSNSRRSRLHTSFDLFYNKELEDFYKAEQIAFTTGDLYQVGLSGGYSRIIGNLSVYLGMGVYVFAHELPSLSIYNRIGLRYNVAERWFINGTVKTHLFVADYFELGLGYRIWRK